MPSGVSITLTFLITLLSFLLIAASTHSVELLVNIVSFTILISKGPGPTSMLPVTLLVLRSIIVTVWLVFFPSTKFSASVTYPIPAAVSRAMCIGPLPTLIFASIELLRRSTTETELSPTLELTTYALLAAGSTAIPAGHTPTLIVLTISFLAVSIIDIVLLPAFVTYSFFAAALLNPENISAAKITVVKQKILRSTNLIILSSLLLV